MEPLLIIVVPGILGGVLIALFMTRIRSHFHPSGVDRPLAPPSPGIINMARIPIAGVGGLGMLAMAVTVAIFVPRIRITMIVALVVGAGLAALLIARRRKEPLPSSGEHAGAHSTMFTDVK